MIFIPVPYEYTLRLTRMREAVYALGLTIATRLLSLLDGATP